MVSFIKTDSLTSSLFRVDSFCPRYVPRTVIIIREYIRDANKTIKPVMGSYRMNSPVNPGQKITGIKAAIVVPVEARIG